MNFQSVRGEVRIVLALMALSKSLRVRREEPQFENVKKISKVVCPPLPSSPTPRGSYIYTPGGGEGSLFLLFFSIVRLATFLAIGGVPRDLNICH